MSTRCLLLHYAAGPKVYSLRQRCAAHPSMSSASLPRLWPPEAALMPSVEHAELYRRLLPQTFRMMRTRQTMREWQWAL